MVRPVAAVGHHRLVDAQLEEILRGIEAVDGWLTDAQATRLFEAARRVPEGALIVEIGSFRGRSTIVLASAAPGGAQVVAIDPHAGNDRGPQELRGFEAEASEDHEVFHTNLRAAGVDGRVTHLRCFSDAAHPDVDGSIDLLYVDGAHRFGPARRDIVGWGARVADGGTVLIHDSFSSIGVTAAILSTLLTGRRFRYIGRSGSLTEYRAHPPAGLGGRLANAGRQLAALPWFARNVVIKLMIVAGRPGWARLLGHRQATWPY